MGVWFRGEAVGVSQQAGRTNPHDFVDGMYLANTPEVGKGFAELRSDDPQLQRLYSVNIDENSIRILDLRSDVRWHNQVRKLGLEANIRQANENYGRIFKNWVKTNNINLEEYDAVVGPLYIGGTRGSLPD